MSTLKVEATGAQWLLRILLPSSSQVTHPSSLIYDFVLFMGPGVSQVSDVLLEFCLLVGLGIGAKCNYANKPQIESAYLFSVITY